MNLLWKALVLAHVACLGLVLSRPLPGALPFEWSTKTAGQLGSILFLLAALLKFKHWRRSTIFYFSAVVVWKLSFLPLGWVLSGEFLQRFPEQVIYLFSVIIAIFFPPWGIEERQKISTFFSLKDIPALAFLLIPLTLSILEDRKEESGHHTRIYRHHDGKAYSILKLVPDPNAPTKRTVTRVDLTPIVQQLTVSADTKSPEETIALYEENQKDLEELDSEVSQQILSSVRHVVKKLGDVDNDMAYLMKDVDARIKVATEKFDRKLWSREESLAYFDKIRTDLLNVRSVTTVHRSQLDRLEEKFFEYWIPLSLGLSHYAPRDRAERIAWGDRYLSRVRKIAEALTRESEYLRNTIGTVEILEVSDDGANYINLMPWRRYYSRTTWRVVGSRSSGILEVAAQEGTEDGEKIDPLMLPPREWNPRVFTYKKWKNEAGERVVIGGPNLGPIPDEDAEK